MQQGVPDCTTGPRAPCNTLSAPSPWCPATHQPPPQHTMVHPITCINCCGACCAWRCLTHSTTRGFTGPTGSCTASCCTSMFTTCITGILMLLCVPRMWAHVCHTLVFHHVLKQTPLHCCPGRSTSPTAFTGYSFHVLEAVLVFANEILVCFMLPMPIELHRLYHLFTTIIHNGMRTRVSFHKRGVSTRYPSRWSCRVRAGAFHPDRRSGHHGHVAVGGGSRRERGAQHGAASRYASPVLEQAL